MTELVDAKCRQRTNNHASVTVGRVRPPVHLTALNRQRKQVIRETS